MSRSLLRLPTLEASVEISVPIQRLTACLALLDQLRAVHNNVVHGLPPTTSCTRIGTAQSSPRARRIQLSRFFEPHLDGRPDVQTLVRRQVVQTHQCSVETQIPAQTVATLYRYFLQILQAASPAPTLLPSCLRYAPLPSAVPNPSPQRKLPISPAP